MSGQRRQCATYAGADQEQHESQGLVVSTNAWDWLFCSESDSIEYHNCGVYNLIVKIVLQK